MAETVIQEKYSLDFDATAALENIANLALEIGELREQLNKTTAGTDGFAKATKQLAAAEVQLVNILAQEVNSYDAINAKRKIAELALKGLEKGTEAYKRVSKEIQALEKRELNTLDGLNAKRQELNKQLGQLEFGTKQYKKTLNELQTVEKKAASETAKITKSAGGFTSALQGGLAAIGITVGLNEVIKFGKESLSLSTEKQQQKTALLEALGDQEAVQERLIAQASEIEARTLVDDKDIIALDAYLASLGLTEKGINKLNEASVQLAAVQGTTVRSAADKLLQARTGEVGELKKLLPEVVGLTKAQLANGAATDLVAKKFAGNAEAMTRGVAGLQNKIKDTTEGFKELAGDAISQGVAKNVAVINNLSKTLPESFGSRFKKAVLDTIEDIVALPATAIASIQAVIAGAVAAFTYLKNQGRLAVLSVKETFAEMQNAVGAISDNSLLDKQDKINTERTRLLIENVGGFVYNVEQAARHAYNDALAGADSFFKDFNKKSDKGTGGGGGGYFPKLTAELKVVSGSMADLQKQLATLKETLSKSVVADDKTALEPLLQKIAELELRIKKVKKLQDELLASPVDPFEALPIVDVQAKQIEVERVKAAIEEQFIKENSANRLKAVELAAQEELGRAAITVKQKEAIEAKYQKEREQIALETDRAITSNAITQRQLELATLKSTATKSNGGNAENIASVKAEIAELEAKLAELGTKDVVINIKTDKASTDKLKAELKEVATAAIELFSQAAAAIGAGFDRGEQRAAAAVEKQKSALDNALANSEEFTAEQIQLEKDRLDKLQKEQERAAARAKAVQTAQIVANTILAVVKAAGQTGVAAPIAIIGVLAAITAGIAAASALAGSAFYDGTDFVPLGGNKKGKDTVPAMLHEGEAVVQADVNKEYGPSVKAIRRRAVPASVLNEFIADWQGGSQMSIPRVNKNNTAIEYGKSTGAMAGSANIYFQARLNVLEREATTQTGLLHQIAKQGNARAGRQVKKGRMDAKRFV